MIDKYTITAFSFWDFCLAVQDAVQKGYKFNDSNENMPQAYIGSYSCTMIKVSDETKEELEQIKDALINAANSLAKEDLIDALKPNSEDVEVPAVKPVTKQTGRKSTK